MPEHPSTKFWYNMKTGLVEVGYESAVVDRVGPFDSREQAENALQVLRKNSQQWEKEESEED